MQRVDESEFKRELSFLGCVWEDLRLASAEKGGRVLDYSKLFSLKKMLLLRMRIELRKRRLESREGPLGELRETTRKLRTERRPFSGALRERLGGIGRGPTMHFTDAVDKAVGERSMLIRKDRYYRTRSFTLRSSSKERR